MKCHTVPYATACSKPTVPKLSSTELEQTNSLRLFGVIHASNLSWKSQSTAIARIVNCMLDAIRRATNIANSNVRFRLFQAFVKPIILFCLLAWGNCYEPSINNIDKVIKRALWLFTNNKSAILKNSLCTSFGLLSYRSLITLKNVILLHNLINVYLKLTHTDNPFAISYLSSRSTRSSSCYKLELVKVKKI